MQFSQVFLDPTADMFEFVAREVPIEIVGCSNKIRGRIGPLGEQNPVLHITIRGNENQQDALLGQADKLHLSDSGRLAAWRQNDAGKMRESGEQVRCADDELLRLRWMELTFDRMDSFRFQRVHDEQAVDKKAVTARCRYASGRCMGAGNAQGEDVVAGIRTPQYLTKASRERAGAKAASMEEAMPAAYAELAARLEVVLRGLV